MKLCKSCLLKKIIIHFFKLNYPKFLVMESAAIMLVNLEKKWGVFALAGGGAWRLGRVRYFNLQERTESNFAQRNSQMILSQVFRASLHIAIMIFFRYL